MLFHKFSKSCALCLLWSLALFFSVAYADDPCEDANKVVRNLVSSLQKSASRTSGHGQFLVKVTEQNGEPVAYRISYQDGNRVLFEKKVAAFVSATNVSIRVGHLDNGKALFYQEIYGATGRIQCPYIVFNKAASFGYITLDFLSVYLLDLDSDGNKEVGAISDNNLVSDCPLSMADRYSLDEHIYRFNTETGKLLDVSERYPQYFATKTKELRERYNGLDKPSPECANGFKKLISRAEALARGHLAQQKPSQVGLDAVNLIQSYYQDLNRHDCNSALQKWAKPPESLCNKVERIEWFKVNNLSLMQADQDNAIVNIDITGKNKSEPQKRWMGPAQLQRIEGNWKIITMRDLRAAQ